MKELLAFKQKGFTLMEVMVSTAIFAFVISSIVAVYLAAIQLDRKTRAQRVLNENARYITEFLTKEVRNGRIDYPSYGGSVNTNEHLWLINEAGELEHIYPNINNCSNSSPCNLLLEKNGSITTLNSSNVSITNFRFYISPTRDPFNPSKNVNEQPKVTLVMTLIANLNSKVQDRVTVNLQTTVSPRYYPKR